MAKSRKILNLKSRNSEMEHERNLGMYKRTNLQIIIHKEKITRSKTQKVLSIKS